MMSPGGASANGGGTTGTQSRQWAIFLTELNKQELDFELIQHADEASRLAVLNSMPSLTPLDRAVVSSTWAKLAARGGTTGSDSAAAGGGSFASTAHPPGSPIMGGGGGQSVGATPYNQGGGRPMMDDSAGGAGVGGSFFGSPGQTPIMMAGARTNMPGVVERSSEAPLQSALNRGDCAAALPLASELLQQDPNTLVSLLHEHLPHISTDQLRNLLGLNGMVPQPASSPVRGAIAGGGAGASPLGGGSAASPGGAAGSAYINGNPLAPGQLLTTQSIAAQFGTGFTATCNGQFLHLPYCVQRDDQIVVRPLNERHL